MFSSFASSPSLLDCHQLLRLFLANLAMALCLSLYVWAIIGWPFVGMFLLLYMLATPKLCPFALAYLLWLWYDWNTQRKGSRSWKWAKEFFVWRIVADYFPIRTVKTAELPTNRNYVFAAHPHAVLATSSGLMFGTNATGFDKLFPGIHMNVVTLPLNFWFPFRREFIMAVGAITSDAHSIAHVLNRPADGHAIGIVPGGVAEMELCRPGEHKLVLANRKGFIKLALQHGADLVPVYHFGENQVYINLPNPEDSFVRKYQVFTRWLVGSSSFPTAYGCSLLSILLPEQWMRKLPGILRYGPLPFRQPILTVVGAPIQVEKVANPSKEQIDALHAEYCFQLRALFDEHKRQGGLPECAILEYV